VAESDLNWRREWVQQSLDWRLEAPERSQLADELDIVAPPQPAMRKQPQTTSVVRHAGGTERISQF